MKKNKKIVLLLLILLLIIVFKPVEKTKINIDKYIYPSKKEEK